MSAAQLARIVGRMEEASQLIRRAIALDPLSARVHRQAALVHIVAGRLDDAATSLSLAMDIAPGASLGHAFLGLTRLLQGRAEEGLAIAQRETHAVFRHLAGAIIQHAMGATAEADAELHALATGYGWTAAYQVAAVHAFRNEVDAAFKWLERAFVALAVESRTRLVLVLRRCEKQLERAFVERDPGVMFAAGDPFLLRLHDDPRWHAFLARAGLPPLSIPAPAASR